MAREPTTGQALPKEYRRVLCMSIHQDMPRPDVCSWELGIFSFSSPYYGLLTTKVVFC